MYLTTHREDARACILAIDGHPVDGRPIKANYGKLHDAKLCSSLRRVRERLTVATLLDCDLGTTNYCNMFLRHLPCSNPDCMYLHDFGDEEVCH